MRDVVVAGASVTGSAAAIHLARAGYSVQLVDRASFPRRKPCGEGLLGPGWRELADLGVLDAIRRESAALDSIRFRLGDVAAEAPLTAGSLGVRRDCLDRRLLDAAIVAGVDFQPGVQVRDLRRSGLGFVAITPRGELEARVIVAADGAQSLLRHRAGLDRPVKAGRYGVSAHVLLPEEPAPRVEVAFHDGFEVYLTPVGGRLVNVALLLSRSQTLDLGGNLRQSFELMIESAGEPLVGFELVDEPLVAGPFPVAATSLWRDNLVLAGDAAGFHDPITGQGMALALQSARLCADAAGAYLQTGSEAVFTAYERKQRQLARNTALLARLMLALAARPALGRRAIANLRRQPCTFARLVALNAGELCLRELRPRDALALVLGV